MMAAYLLKAAEEGAREEPRWITIYLGWVALVPAPPHRDDRSARSCSSSARWRWCRCCRPASSRPTTCRRRRCSSPCRRAATFEQTHRRRPSGARDRRSRNQHVKLVYTAIGGGTHRRRSVHGAAAPAEVAQGDADPQPDAARRAPRRQEAGDRARAARRAGRRAGRAHQRRLRRLEREVHAGPGRRGRRGARRTSPRKVERELRTLPGIGNVTSIVEPGAARAGGAARLRRAPPTSASPRRRSPTRCASPPPATTTRAWPSSTSSQRQVPIVVKLPARRARDLGLISRLAVPGARGPVMLGNVATLAIDSGPAQIDRYDRLRNVNFDDRAQRAAARRRCRPRRSPCRACSNLPPGVHRRPPSATPRRWPSCSTASAWPC